MRVVADLHLHSKYSRAVSQQMVIPEIARWAKRKGIDLVGVPDWTHPLWFRELQATLVEAGEGVYRFRDEPKGPLFLLATEISSIYSQGGQTRRIHNLVLVPGLTIADKINRQLRSRGVNLLSDGRPITGLSSQELAEIVFSVSPQCLLIPAHIWTPWFSLFGSRSGFDSLKECFGPFSQYILAVETGLSSNPAMNWRVEELDKRAIVSFSDAHSPAKLGREVTIFEVDRVNYPAIRQALKEGKVIRTIEFYPEEGKYHFTGHRKCGVKQTPAETKKLGASCPVCGKPLTVGVMHRVEELAKRPEDFQPPNRPDYQMMVPLTEILSESLGVGVSSKSVISEYNRLTKNFPSELDVLLRIKTEEIVRIAGEKVAEGIKKVREGDLVIDPGYDGVFGTVKIWGKERKEGKKQMSLF